MTVREPGGPTLLEVGIPEHLRPKEYGRREVLDLPLSQVVRLNQVRDGLNPEIASLRASIRTQGLINPIDVARLSPDSFRDYVNFTNSVWGSDTDPDAFQPDEHGWHYLTIAGHSRFEAIIQEEEDRSKEAADQGYVTDPLAATVRAKIHHDPTPQEIISLQLDENIYRQPNQERRAMAVVETYMYGLQAGQWQNQAEFVRAGGGKFSEKLLGDALAFMELDANLRDLVFVGQLKYGPCVELGKAVPAYRDFLLKRFYEADSADELDEETRVEYEGDVLRWAAVEATNIQVKKLNVTSARTRYEGLVVGWQKKLAKINGEEVSGFEEMQLFTARQAREDRWNERRRMLTEYEGNLRIIGSGPLHAAARTLSIHERLHGDPQAVAKLRDELTSRLESFVSGSGQVAAEAAYLKLVAGD